MRHWSAHALPRKTQNLACLSSRCNKKPRGPRGPAGLVAQFLRVRNPARCSHTAYAGASPPHSAQPTGLEVEADADAPVELAVAEGIFDVVSAIEEPSVLDEGIDERALLHVELSACLEARGESVMDTVAI